MKAGKYQATVSGDGSAARTQELGAALSRSPAQQLFHTAASWVIRNQVSVRNFPDNLLPCEVFSQAVRISLPASFSRRPQNF